MLYTELTKKAMNICYDMHHGVKDKGGVPYVFHPFHVAEQMDTEYEICVALLHDVIEDTDMTIDELRTYGFPDEIIEAISVITKPKNMNYEDYIQIVKTNKLATKVKLADIEHNSQTSRLPDTSERTIKRMEKYARAKESLLG